MANVSVSESLTLVSGVKKSSKLKSNPILKENYDAESIPALIAAMAIAASMS